MTPARRSVKQLARFAPARRRPAWSGRPGEGQKDRTSATSQESLLRLIGAADVVIEAIFENLEAKLADARFVFVGRPFIYAAAFEADETKRTRAVLEEIGNRIVALTYFDAQRLGLKPEELNFDSEIRTAGGVTYGAHVTLDSIRIGKVKVENVNAVILRTELEIAMALVSRPGDAQQTPPWLVDRIFRNVLNSESPDDVRKILCKEDYGDENVMGAMLAYDKQGFQVNYLGKDVNVEFSLPH